MAATEMGTFAAGFLLWKITKFVGLRMILPGVALGAPYGAYVAFNQGSSGQAAAGAMDICAKAVTGLNGVLQEGFDDSNVAGRSALSGVINIAILPVSIGAATGAAAGAGVINFAMRLGERNLSRLSFSHAEEPAEIPRAPSGPQPMIIQPHADVGR